MKRTVYLFIAISMFSSCFASRETVSNRDARNNNREVREVNGGATNSGYTPNTSLQYIDMYKGIAIREMKAFGIPASITIAQGLYESGAGNSELARVANNHFGIKAGYSWNGKVYYKDDDNKNDAFRVYSSAEESFRDHSNFLKKKNYAALYSLDITDYKGWAWGLKRAGYATNPNYPEIIIGIIEKYNLEQYDEQGAVAAPVRQQLAAAPIPATTAAPVAATSRVPVTTSAPPAAAPVTASVPVTSVPVQVPPPPPVNTPSPDSTATASAPAAKSYTVKQGDTLYNISHRFGLTVDDLRTINNLNGNNIQIGQVLVVVK